MSTLNETRKELAPSFFAATIPGPSRKNWRFELKSAGIESNPSFPFKASSQDGQKAFSLVYVRTKKTVMVASFSLGFSSFEAVSSCLELKRLKNYVLHPILFFSHFSLQRGFFSESFRLNLQLDFFSLSLEIKFVWRLKPKSDWWP